ncbi:MAG: signal recognition particle-docking protein FtsY [Spirochaetaceae bacterium]|jgi:fused signal recognition particle receptor|nr:signal recognition particle-docking protein FtsY [Spirochaetaceae bacterium]
MSFGETLRKLFKVHSGVEQAFFEELTDALIEGDIGAKAAFQLMDRLEKKCRTEHIADEAAVTALLRDELAQTVRAFVPDPSPGRTNIWLLLGVNGVGKTTTAAKLAGWYTGRQPGLPCILAAADTFRAAAIEQLKLHGRRLGVRVVAQQHGADPAAVVYDAADAVTALAGGLVLVDTAGRLHNKENLVRELQKIERVAQSRAGEGCCKKLLVLDATTGQNAVAQTEVFHRAVGVDAVILTKADSAAKGGALFTIGREMDIPGAFVCTGETYADIRPFDPAEYTNSFLDIL